MQVTIKNGNWFDERDRQLTKEEVEAMQRQIKDELDTELLDTGFEGWVKRFVTKRVVNGKKAVHIVTD